MKISLKITKVWQYFSNLRKSDRLKTIFNENAEIKRRVPFDDSLLSVIKCISANELNDSDFDERIKLKNEAENQQFSGKNPQKEEKFH